MAVGQSSGLLEALPLSGLGNMPSPHSPFSIVCCRRLNFCPRLWTALTSKLWMKQ